MPGWWHTVFRDGLFETVTDRALDIVTNDLVQENNMELLTSSTSPFGRVPRIVIAEHGLTVTEVPVMVWKERDKLVGRNPLSKVPVLMLDADTPIIDSCVIAAYLDSLGQEPLLPADARERAQMESACAVCMGLADCAAAIFAPKAMLGAELPEAVVTWHRAKIDGAIAALADWVAAGRIGGARFTMLDACAVAALGFCDFRLADVLAWRAAHPQLAAAIDRLNERPSVAGTKPGQ